MREQRSAAGDGDGEIHPRARSGAAFDAAIRLLAAALAAAEEAVLRRARGAQPARLLARIGAARDELAAVSALAAGGAAAGNLGSGATGRLWRLRERTLGELVPEALAHASGAGLPAALATAREPTVTAHPATRTMRARRRASGVR